jgi:hypothetical protein
VTYRSNKLLALVRRLPCVRCGVVGVQAAHSNLGRHGKGKSIKASDAAIMALCPECHAELDQGGVFSKAEAEAIIDRHIAETYITLIETGLLKP